MTRCVDSGKSLHSQDQSIHADTPLGLARYKEINTKNKDCIKTIISNSPIRI